MLGHGPLDALLEGKRRMIAEHAACLFDRVVQVQSQKLEAGLVDDRGVLGASELGAALDHDGEEFRQPERQPPGRRLKPGQLGDAAHELLLGDWLAVSQVEHFADGSGVLGGEKDAAEPGSSRRCS